MKNNIKLKNTNHWQAFGSYESKMNLINLLLKNGFLLFDVGNTLEILKRDGVYIKSVDIDRRGNRGNFMISSEEYSNNITSFNLDRIEDHTWLLEFIYAHKKTLVDGNRNKGILEGSNLKRVL